MIIGTLSSIPYARFAAALALPAVASLLLVAGVLHLMFRRDLPHRRLASARIGRPEVDRRLLAKSLGATALVLVGFAAGFPLAWTALTGAALCMAVSGRVPREALMRVDWPLLLFFAGLFVVVAGVGRSGAADRMHEGIAPFLGEGAVRQTVVFSAFSVAASQLVSNVPFVLLAGSWIPNTADPDLMWLATALSSTLAGNLTIVGSVANIIVLELAGERGRIGFWRFLAYGLPVTALTLVVSLALLLGERSLGLLAGSP